MRKLFLAAAAIGALLALSACGGQAPAKSSPTPLAQVYAAEAGFTTALAIAVNYTDLPRCGRPAAPPVCSDPSAVAEIRKAANSGKAIIDAAIATVRAPGATTDGAKAAAAAAVNALAALQQVLTTYNVK